MLISVVIPVYNAASTIRKCLDSVIVQTYNKIEIFIVDDGSTDESGEICKEYAKNDTRIFYERTENRGVSCARNLGLSRCRGDWVTFVDSDDYIDLGLFAAYASAVEKIELKSINASLVMTGMVEEDYTTVDSGIYYNVLDLPEGTHLVEKNKIPEISWKKILNFVTNKLYRTENIKSNSIIFSEKIRIAEDLLFNIDYLEKTPGELFVINKPLYHYVRRFRYSLSLSYYPEAVSHTKEVYRKFINYYAALDGSTEDGKTVLESFYIADWTSRMVTRYLYYKNGEFERDALKKAREDINSKEYQSILRRVYKARKISFLRYLPLRTRRFKLYVRLRSRYQKLKYS